MEDQIRKFSLLNKLGTGNLIEDDEGWDNKRIIIAFDRNTDIIGTYPKYLYN